MTCRNGPCYDSCRIAYRAMESAIAPAKVFRFGLFEADVCQGTLTRAGVRVKIQDQPFRVLLLLLDRPGEIVTREELRQKLWPEGTFVDFDGSLNVILKKLRAGIDDDSDNPRFIETVPRRGYRFIAPVSESRSNVGTSSAAAAVSTRPQTASAPPTDSTDIPQTKNNGEHRQMTSGSYILIYTVAALVMAVALAALWLALHRGVVPLENTASGSRQTTPVSMRKSVAVLGFHNISGKVSDSWLATAFSEMLSTELAGGEKLRLISGGDVANLHISSPWSQTDTLDQATTSRIGAALNSDLLVLGSYTTIGNRDRGQVRLDVRLQDAKTGEILTEVAEIGSTQDLFQIVSRAGSKLRDRLGVPRLEEPGEASVLASVPRDRDAARFYALGVAKLRQFDPSAAKDLLQEAVISEPKFSLGHAMLARAWSQLGYEQNRREEAKKALDLANDLPRAERMLVEGEYYESLGDQERAASTYHALFELFPDNVEYGLRLATAQSMAGHNSQASATLSQLRHLPSPASDDPRIDLLDARVGPTNDPARLVLIRSAERKADAQGKALLYAETRKEECLNLNYSAHPDSAPPACEDAYNIFIAMGNRVGAADAIRLMADGIGSQGHYEQAIATYERALNILEGMGEHQKTGSILNNMAINFENEGKLDKAEKLYRQAMSHFAAAGNKTNQAVALGNIADILYLRGNLVAAEKMYRQDLVAMADKEDPSYTLYRLADLELMEGRVAQARQHAEQAVSESRAHQGEYQYLTGAMEVLGEAFAAQADLGGARRQFEESLEIRQKVGAVELVAEAQLELANLALDERHPEKTEPLLRSAIAEFEKEQGDPAASTAYTLLSRTLLMKGKLDESRKAIQRSIELSKTSSDPALRLPAEIQAARVEMTSPDSQAMNSARQELRSTIASAKKLGYYYIECEARLAFGELDLKSNPASGHAELAALAGETRSHGMEFLAHQAEQAFGSGSMVAANKPSQ
jgi:eukaryotic-like serine/threonine-protein kinase